MMKLFGFDKGVHTILMARLVVLAGVVASVGLTIDWAPTFPEWCVPVVLLTLGVVQELVRRYRADDV